MVTDMTLGSYVFYILLSMRRDLLLYAVLAAVLLAALLVVLKNLGVFS